MKKRSLSKVSRPRPPRITNCILGLPAIGQKSLGKTKAIDDPQALKLGKKCYLFLILDVLGIIFCVFLFQIR